MNDTMTPEVAQVVVDNELIAKVKRLERRVSSLEKDLDETRKQSLRAMVGPLRLRETVLLYIGAQDFNEFYEELTVDFGPRIAQDMARHLFVLNDAPLSDTDRESFRSVFEHGMNLWPRDSHSLKHNNHRFWKVFAYPLQQIVIHLQGTRNSDRNAIIDQLETVLSRLRSGDMKGTEHDDDFGYAFECRESPEGPSFFSEDPAGAA